MANLARMRTVKQCYEYFKKEDPESSISEWYLRNLCVQNKIQVFHTGRKRLINLDKLIEYLNSEPVDNEKIPFNYGTIRKVGE